MMERRDADGGAGGAAGTGGHPGQAWARVRAWFKNPTIMRAFFGYALVWLVVASTVVLVAIGALMEVYYRVSDEHRAEHVEVNAGPYIYDAATDELLRATPVYLEDSYDHIVFVAFVHAARDEAEDSIVAGGWNRDMRVVDATMGLLRSDPSYRVSDWGGNYTEEQYRATGGEPYDPDATISTDDLAAYDARERAARLQTVDAFGAGDFGEDVLLSNVAYYVALDEASYLTWVDWALRLTAGIGVPILAYGGLAVLLFRRFYRRYIGGPLAELGGAAERIAARDLDFQIDPVRGRELSGLAAAMERMRAALLESQRELWRTAEDRRRLNAAFAHDLRTSVTVLKGTVELARARAHGEESPAGVEGSLAVISEQVERLERYAAAMARVTKCEDRACVRAPVKPAEAVDAIERQATAYVAARGTGCGLRFAVSDRLRARARADGGVPLELDMQVVEEVLGNVLSNACGHASALVTVELDLAPGGDAATSAAPDASPALAVTVTDDGPGFSAEALRHGCDAFFSEKKSAEHFGLGLNVARVLARLHGGEVALTNAPEGGARVTVTFAA